MRVSARVVGIGTALLAVGVLAVGGKADRSASATRDPRAAIFIQRGCAECHAIAALGVKAATDVAPDLTFAYADVQNRYQLNLASFLENPRGLMGFVFTAHVTLTQSDRDSMARTLEALYRERLADMDENIPSLPPVHRLKPGESRRADR
jgi:cytochrome c551/c552